MNLEFYWAVYSGNFKKVEQYIQEQEDVNFMYDANETLLHVAVRGGFTKIVSALLKAGANVNPFENDYTPLHKAAYEGHTKIVNVLLKHGANINSTDNCLTTPLHEAVVEGHIGTVIALVEQGADLTIKNQYGNTPFYKSIIYGHLEIALFLIEKGASVDHFDLEIPLLHEAIFEDYIDIVLLLIQAGSDINLLNQEGKKPLEIASSINSVISKILTAPTVVCFLQLLPILHLDRVTLMSLYQSLSLGLKEQTLYSEDEIFNFFEQELMEIVCIPKNLMRAAINKVLSNLGGYDCSFFLDANKSDAVKTALVLGSDLIRYFFDNHMAQMLEFILDPAKLSEIDNAYLKEMSKMYFPPANTDRFFDVFRIIARKYQNGQNYFFWNEMDYVSNIQNSAMQWALIETSLLNIKKEDEKYSFDCYEPELFTTISDDEYKILLTRTDLKRILLDNLFKFFNETKTQLEQAALISDKELSL